jgi:hypothetical protein
MYCSVNEHRPSLSVNQRLKINGILDIKNANADNITDLGWCLSSRQRDMNCPTKRSMIPLFNGYVTSEYWVPRHDKNISSEVTLTF